GLADPTNLSRGISRNASSTGTLVTSVVRSWLSTILIRCWVKSMLMPLMVPSGAYYAALVILSGTLRHSAANNPLWPLNFPTLRKNSARRDAQGYGGLARNRTGVQGFAVLCVTAPPRGLVAPAYRSASIGGQDLVVKPLNAAPAAFSRK